MCISTSLKVEVVTLCSGEQGRRLTEAWGDGSEVVPNKFVFDGASSPRPVWIIVPPYKWLERSCRHDWDCYLARKVRDRGGLRNATIAKRLRCNADLRFRKKTELKEGPIIATLAYWGIRTGSFFGAGWRNREYKVKPCDS